MFVMNHSWNIIYYNYYCTNNDYVLDKGASRDPCGETYSGRRAFSEPEARSIAKYLIGIKERLFAYLSFHSYSQLLLFPYGDGEHRINNFNETVCFPIVSFLLKIPSWVFNLTTLLRENFFQVAIGIETAKSLANRYGTKYIVGNVVDTLCK